MIHRTIKNELAHFKKLPEVSRQLLRSFLFFHIAGPLMGVFINAYLWRNTNDILIVFIYNTTAFIGLPFGTVLNGLLLKNFRPNLIFFLSTFGISISAFIILIGKYNYEIIGALGFFIGMVEGFYWANRNLFTSKVTNETIRNYFTGTEFTISVLTSIIIPIITGWFIEFGKNANLYSIDNAYIIIAILIILLLFISGIFAYRVDIGECKVTQIFKWRTTKYWKNMRLFMILFGFVSGLTFFLPTLFILIYLGNEGVLGTFQSFFSLLSAIAIYVIGRKSSPHHRFHVMVFGTILLITGTTILGGIFNSAAIICFLILQQLSQTFLQTSYSNIFFSSIEKDDAEDDYWYFVDNEVLLNIGRVSAVILFLIMYFNYSPEFALRYSLFLVSIVQIVVLIFARKLMRK